MLAHWSDIIWKYWGKAVAEHPWLLWVQRWGISVASLLSGVLTLFLFRRGIEYFPWFIGYLLLLWLAGVVFAHARQVLRARRPLVMGLVVDYSVQTLLHWVLLFLIPIYYASTTLGSRNMWFLLALVAGTLLTAVDPWYRAVHLRYRRIELLLFWFGLLASLNVAFPLIGIESTWGLLLSGAASVTALLPAFRRAPEAPWTPALLCTAGGAVLVVSLLWLLRPWIPPAPLRLARATFAQAVVRLEPVQPVSRVSVSEVRQWGGLSCFTAIVAPAGIREPILHVWRRDGVVVATIPLSPILGGLRGGFRTYSRRVDMGNDPVGSWWVDVLTAHHQLIGRVRLTVRP
jgi:hypothetical protein